MTEVPLVLWFGRKARMEFPYEFHLPVIRKAAPGETVSKTGLHYRMAVYLPTGETRLSPATFGPEFEYALSEIKEGD